LCRTKEDYSYLDGKKIKQKITLNVLCEKIFLSSLNWYENTAERLALTILYGEKKRFFLSRLGLALYL
jgi:hypothetical protein